MQRAFYTLCIFFSLSFLLRGLYLYPHRGDDGVVGIRFVTVLVRIGLVVDSDEPIVHGDGATDKMAHRLAQPRVLRPLAHACALHLIVARDEEIVVVGAGIADNMSDGHNKLALLGGEHLLQHLAVHIRTQGAVVPLLARVAPLIEDAPLHGVLRHEEELVLTAALHDLPLYEEFLALSDTPGAKGDGSTLRL